LHFARKPLPQGGGFSFEIFLRRRQKDLPGDPEFRSFTRSKTQASGSPGLRVKMPAALFVPIRGFLLLFLFLLKKLHHIHP
jgi:hypothetical protein